MDVRLQGTVVRFLWVGSSGLLATREVLDVPLAYELFHLFVVFMFRHGHMYTLSILTYLQALHSGVDINLGVASPFFQGILLSKDPQET